ncbi:MAG: hypothetical protein IBX61_03755 [Thermoleophilia bacterium]|nr:hypothetical protein [Thermoleophilia bacterium]
MDLAEFFGVIRKWKWLILAVIVVATAYAGVSGARSTQMYQAESTLVVGLSQIASATGSGISLAQSGDRIGATYAELVTGNEVMENALGKANLNWNPNVLKARTATESIRNTSVLKIAVTDSDPVRVQVLANAVAESFVDYLKEASQDAIEQTAEMLTDDLADIGDEISSLSAAQPAGDQGKLRALQDRRDAILEGLENLQEQKAASTDVRIADEATLSRAVGVPMTQRILIGFMISVFAGSMLAFVTEAVISVRKNPDE